MRPEERISAVRVAFLLPLRSRPYLFKSFAGAASEDVWPDGRASSQLCCRISPELDVIK